MSSNEDAIVVDIGGRFFYGFGKNGQVLTAAYLAGATLFGGLWDRKLERVRGILYSKQKEYLLRRVEVSR